MFETRVVRANNVTHCARSGGINSDILSIFFNIKASYVFSLESPHRGDSNENTQYIIFNMRKK